MSPAAAAEELDDAELATATFEILNGLASEPLPRHRHRLTRKDVRQSQTARVLAAAIELFGDQGFAETTVAQIADRAGVSRRTVYDLYDSKEEVFLHTYRCTQLLIAAGAEFRDGVSGAALTVESLPVAVRRLLTLIAQAPAAARLFFLEATGAGAQVRVRRNEAIAAFVSAVTPSLQALRRDAEPDLPALSGELCNAVVAVAIELIVQYLSDERPETLPDLTASISRAISAIVTPNH